MTGVLYCGDNLEILGNDYIASESIDLIYLDPPFNSQRTYNVVYKGSRAQETAFKDYWSWQEAAATYAGIQASHEMPLRARSILKALHDQLIDDDSDLLAYLTMMAPRLVGLHRALKITGSLYLHCDPTASHYLKVLLDSIFQSHNFRSEVIWKRSSAHSGSRRWGPLHDSLLFYTKSDDFTWNPLFLPEAAENVGKWYVHEDARGRYKRGDLTGAGTRTGESAKPWRGWDPTPKGRHWAVPREIVAKVLGKDSSDLSPQQALDVLFGDGRIIWPKKVGGQPMLRRYLHEAKGVPAGDVITDIPPLSLSAMERVGWPTQKPIDLLARIIQASSKEGDLVLDPFCGCGTTIVACEKLGRRWIGIDVARKAVDILEARFTTESLPEPSIIWHPADPEAAAALAERDPDQFEAWIRRKIRAEKRKKDRGIDGECFYKEVDGKSWHVILSVKGGRSLNPGMVRDLRGTIEREGAPIGVLVCMYEPSKEMRLEATRAGFLPVSDVGGPIPRIQIVTIEQLFSERVPIRAPGENVTPRALPAVPQKGQTGLIFPPTKARPAREAQARAAIESKAAASAIAESVPLRASASGAEAKSQSRPPSRPPKRR